MTFADFGAIGGLIAGVVAVVGLLYGIAHFVSDVYAMNRSLQSLMITRTPDVIQRYENTIISKLKPSLTDEMVPLLGKLGGRHKLNPIDANRLIQMLEDEKTEAKRKGQQDAVLAIAALIEVVHLLTEKQIPNSV